LHSSIQIIKKLIESLKLNKISFVLIAAIVMTMAQSSSAWAVNVQKFRPTTGHVEGMQVFTSETLPKYYFAFGVSGNYANHPLEQTPAGSTARLAGIVDQLVTMDALMTYGLMDWLTISLDMPIAVYENIAPTLIPNRSKEYFEAGDLQATAKIRIRNNTDTGKIWGVALVPFITFPSGDPDIYTGDSFISGGVIAVSDWEFKDNRIYLNVGSLFREGEAIDTLQVGHEFLYALGYQRPIVKKWDFDGILEVFGATRYENMFEQDRTTPLEGILTLRKKWLKDRNLITQVGGGMAISNGYGLPNYRIHAGISYGFSVKPEEKQEVLPLKGKIYFDYDKAVIKKESYPIVDDVVEQMKARPGIKVLLIEGHTDSDGSDDYNMRLSLRRANALKAYLVQHGIDASRLRTVGYGESQPIASNDTDEGKAMNRRSVFRILEGN